MKQILTFIILIMGVCSSILKADALPEYTIKAAYLYNFALLTDWPEEKQKGNFNLCLYGQDAFGAALDALENKKIGEQTIKTIFITSPQEAKKCHIVFIGENEHQKEQKMIEEIAGLPILIVTDNANVKGYHIVILQDNERLSFTINTKALKEANLNLSSRLLNLAKKVK
ncbi:YfiR family protein [Sulfurospirillum oryzae]|uniref:YfiR family protein n=1 Tax=Sulfurospirillum oryzae TaxID=2976535 RepID=UPI0021E85864|nr:YfiR family protein [Sulfurospirillum oryzae]